MDRTEVELRFLVPQRMRAALAGEMARGSVTLARQSLVAMYLDTDDRRLAQAGIVWRLRREAGRWIQTLKAGGGLERLEHDAILPDATPDPTGHAGTPVGNRLLAILRHAQAEDHGIGLRFQTEVRRTTRRIRTRGAVVEVAFDEGRLLAAGSSKRIREVEFERLSGTTTAMLALAERWRKRFGLILEPRSVAERGSRLAEGLRFPPLRKALRPEYPQRADATGALGAVLGECLAHVTSNAIGLVDGDPALRVEHVHQLRVGIRRLRSALRCFAGWTPPPTAGLVDELRELFATLGRSRDSDVLDGGVVAALAEAGAPPLMKTKSVAVAAPDPAEAIRADPTQRLLLGWIAWCAALAEQPFEPESEGPHEPIAPLTRQRSAAENGATGAGMASEQSPGEAGALSGADAPASRPEPTDADRRQPSRRVAAVDFHRRAARRLAKWHRRIAADAKAFEELDEEGLHSLRKRVKRQRYAVEFFVPVLRRREVDRYLKPLVAIQDRLGQLNDLFVARARYQALVASDPEAWFALGWLAARIVEVRELAKPELRRLAKADPPSG